MTHWIRAIVFGAGVTHAFQAAATDLFHDNPSTLEALETASPTGAECGGGQKFRVGYGEEIAYCRHEGAKVVFRFAAAKEALLLDLHYDVLALNRTYPEGEISAEIQGYLDGASALFDKLSFPSEVLKSCIGQQQLAYKEHHDANGATEKPSATRIERPPLVMRCRWLPTGVYATVRPLIGELKD